MMVLTGTASFRLLNRVPREALPAEHLLQWSGALGSTPVVMRSIARELEPRLQLPHPARSRR